MPEHFSTRRLKPPLNVSAVRASRNSSLWRYCQKKTTIIDSFSEVSVRMNEWVSGNDPSSQSFEMNEGGEKSVSLNEGERCDFLLLQKTTPTTSARSTFIFLLLQQIKGKRSKIVSRDAENQAAVYNFLLLLSPETQIVSFEQFIFPLAIRLSLSPKVEKNLLLLKRWLELESKLSLKPEKSERKETFLLKNIEQKRTVKKSENLQPWTCPINAPRRRKNGTLLAFPTRRFGRLRLLYK